MTTLAQPVTVIRNNGERVDLSYYLDLCELPIRLEPVIGKIFGRTEILEHELKTYIIANRGTDEIFSHYVILEDGTVVPIIEYENISEANYHDLFSQVLTPYKITHIYERDLKRFIWMMHNNTNNVRKRVM